MQKQLQQHVMRLKNCRLCPKMHAQPVSGGAVVSRIILIGQAPGDKEPKLGRPFAWTAGKTLFRWFEQAAGLTEEQFRSQIYMAAVCRCFPGKKESGGDRVPAPDEIENCSSWLEQELKILKPKLLIPVGKLAIGQFLPLENLELMIGRKFSIVRDGCSYDVIPLPHPSGASPWHRKEPGKTLLDKALKQIVMHPAFRGIL
jgi:uracil-DNA glycosylase